MDGFAGFTIKLLPIRKHIDILIPLYRILTIPTDRGDRSSSAEIQNIHFLVVCLHPSSSMKTPNPMPNDDFEPYFNSAIMLVCSIRTDDINGLKKSRPIFSHSLHTCMSGSHMSSIKYE